MTRLIKYRTNLVRTFSRLKVKSKNFVTKHKRCESESIKPLVRPPRFKSRNYVYCEKQKKISQKSTRSREVIGLKILASGIQRTVVFTAVRNKGGFCVPAARLTRIFNRFWQLSKHLALKSSIHWPRKFQTSTDKDKV